MIKNNDKIIINIIAYCFLTIAIFFQNSKSLAQENEDKGKNNNTSGVTLFEDKNETQRFSNTAIVQILNKTTAKNSVVELKINNKVNLSTITLKAHKCWQSPLDQKPETKILLEVFENKLDEKTNSHIPHKRIFFGWLFASSPSISGMEHPIYDIIALSCTK